MNRTVLSDQVNHIANRLNKTLRILAQGDYRVDDIVSIHTALNEIEGVLDSLVVVDRSPKPTSSLRMYDTATPTIIKAKRRRPSIPKNSPLDMPHETDLKRR